MPDPLDSLSEADRKAVSANPVEAADKGMKVPASRAAVARRSGVGAGVAGGRRAPRRRGPRTGTCNSLPPPPPPRFRRAARRGSLTPAHRGEGSMTNPRAVAGAAIALALWAAGPAPVARSEDKAASSKVVVDKASITFDPKTCAEGRGVIYWGLGSSSVRVLGNKDGQCVFEYVAEVEMGQTVYLVRVPADAGPVTVKADPSGRGVVTSFPLDKARVVRRGGPHGCWEVRVGDTDDFVWYRPGERRSEMEPRAGDTVKVRLRVFDGPGFATPVRLTEPDPAVEFVLGAGKGWPWLETAMEGMAVGDRRQIHVPSKVAGGLTAWLAEPKVGKVLYVEASLVRLDRGK